MGLTEPTLVDALGYLAAACVFLTFCMRTMLPLRLVAIASNIAFISYAIAASLAPILILHGALLPLNILRLIQMQRQVASVGATPETPDGDDRFDWLIPLAEPRKLAPGERLFERGDEAESLYVIIGGEIELPEIGVRLGPGAMLGEIGLFAEDRRRTTSARAKGPVELAELTERRVERLYFDNPRFAYRLIRMVTQRLIENLARAEERATGRRPDSVSAEIAVRALHDKPPVARSTYAGEAERSSRG